MQDNRIPRPMTEAEILRRRELRRAAIKKQKRRRTLSIDFEAEALTDCEYEVAYIDTGLELTAGKGTTTQGEKYILNRTEK